LKKFKILQKQKQGEKLNKMLMQMGRPNKSVKLIMKLRGQNADRNYKDNKTSKTITVTIIITTSRAKPSQDKSTQKTERSWLTKGRKSMKK